MEAWAEKIHRTLESADLKDASIVDIGGGYGIFSEEYRTLSNADLTIIEPNGDLAKICRSKGFNVIQKFLEDVSEADIPDGKRVFTCFELFEHVQNPEIFFRSIYSLMKTGDYLFLTTLSGTGLDIRVLWERSKSVSPPHHLNFLNPNSMRILLERCNYEVISIETPGKLDIDILENNISSLSDRFWEVLLGSASESEKVTLQAAISSVGFSSHMQIFCRKS